MKYNLFLPDLDLDLDLDLDMEWNDSGTVPAELSDDLPELSDDLPIG